jgi:hypothetical protein
MPRTDKRLPLVYEYLQRISTSRPHKVERTPQVNSLDLQW